MRIGIDFGNVISGGSGEDSDMFFGDDWLNTPEISGALESVKELSQSHELVVISKCGAKIQARTLGWMEEHGFHETTGITLEEVFFVRKRQQKAPLALKLSLDAFIDDRADVLSYMAVEPNIVEHRLLFTSWDKTMRDISKIERFGKLF